MLIANAVAMTADAYSDVVRTQDDERHFHFQIESAATGNRAGTIYVQISDDNATFYSVPVRNRLTGVMSAGMTVTTSTLLNDEIDVETSAQFLRLFFDYSSGTTGTFNAWVTAKKG